MGLINTFGCVRISRAKPRITVRINGLQDIVPTGEENTELFLSRVGDDIGEFASYLPLEEQGDYLTFQFDALLFAKPSGRYNGRLVVRGNSCTTIHLQFENSNCSVVSVTSEPG